VWVVNTIPEYRSHDGRTTLRINTRILLLCISIHYYNVQRGSAAASAGVSTRLHAVRNSIRHCVHDLKTDFNFSRGKLENDCSVSSLCLMHWCIILYFSYYIQYHLIRSFSRQWTSFRILISRRFVPAPKKNNTRTISINRLGGRHTHTHTHSYIGTYNYRILIA